MNVMNPIVIVRDETINEMGKPPVWRVQMNSVECEEVRMTDENNNRGGNSDWNGYSVPTT